MARMRLEARLFSVTYWSTTIVVRATFDSGQLASLRSLTEVSGPMCLILVDPRLFDALLPFRAIEIDRENSQITIPEISKKMPNSKTVSTPPHREDDCFNKRVFR
jgi:hypothetical protein